MARRPYSGAQIGAARKRFAAAGRPGPVFGVRLSRRILPAQRGFMRRSGFYGRYGSRAIGSESEQKFFDTALAFSVDSAGEVPATGQLVLIPQGVTESTRVGRKCVVKSIVMRGNFSTTFGVTSTGGVLVLYLILDKQCNGAAAAATDVFMSTSFTSNGMRNLANSSRFVILKRWIIHMNPMAGIVTVPMDMVRHIEFYKKCNIPLEFSSTTGAITELKSNNLFLMAVSSGPFDDWAAFAGTCRVRFTD